MLWVLSGWMAAAWAWIRSIKPVCRASGSAVLGVSALAPAIWRSSAGFWSRWAAWMASSTTLRWVMSLTSVWISMVGSKAGLLVASAWTRGDLKSMRRVATDSYCLGMRKV